MGLVSGALQRLLPGHIEGRYNRTTRLGAPLSAEADHAGEHVGGALRRSLPGPFEGRSKWTTWIATQPSADVYHADRLVDGATHWWLPGETEVSLYPSCIAGLSPFDQLSVSGLL